MTAFPSSLPSPHLGGKNKVLNNALTSEMDNGYVVSRKKYSRQIHTHEMSWSALTTAQLAILQAFYQSVNGGAGEFTVTTDENVTRTVRFTSDLDYCTVTPGLWEVSVSVREV